MNLSRFASVDLVIFDFDGVFTDNTVVVSQDGVESVRCWRSDGLGLNRVRSCGVATAIVSTEKNNVVKARAEKLQIQCLSGIDDKALAVRQLCTELGVALERTMFVGNDINDIPALQIVGFPVGVADSYPEILPYIDYVTKKAGGFGAVREICDLIYLKKEVGNAN